jgi:hypothetical protein
LANAAHISDHALAAASSTLLRRRGRMRLISGTQRRGIDAMAWSRVLGQAYLCWASAWWWVCQRHVTARCARADSGEDEGSRGPYRGAKQRAEQALEQALEQGGHASSPESRLNAQMGGIDGAREHLPTQACAAGVGARALLVLVEPAGRDRRGTRNFLDKPTAGI